MLRNGRTTRIFDFNGWIQVIQIFVCHLPSGMGAGQWLARIAGVPHDRSQQ